MEELWSLPLKSSSSDDVVVGDDLGLCGEDCAVVDLCDLCDEVFDIFEIIAFSVSEADDLDDGDTNGDDD